MAFLAIILFLVSCGNSTKLESSQPAETQAAVAEVQTVQTTAAASTQAVETEKEPKLDKWTMSADQKNLTSRLGYPDEFLIFYDDYDNLARSETWSYTLLQSSFFFYNGDYRGSRKVISDENTSIPASKITPQDFVYQLGPWEVNYIMGAFGDEIVDTTNSKRYLLFNNASTVFIFNSNDNLISVVNLLKPVYEKS